MVNGFRQAAGGMQEWFGVQFKHRPIGVTVQVDEGHEVFDAKNSSLHPLFNKT